MIALLAAAALSAAPQPVADNAPPPLLLGARLQVLAGNAAVCNKDPRMEQAAAERAILRNTDQRYVAKRLIDLPVAYACQVGGQREGGK